MNSQNISGEEITGEIRAHLDWWYLATYYAEEDYARSLYYANNILNNPDAEMWHKANAYLRLGKMYHYGNGLDQSNELALQYYNTILNLDIQDDDSNTDDCQRQVEDLLEELNNIA